MSYYDKYIKYKEKYTNLKATKQRRWGGGVTTLSELQNKIGNLQNEIDVLQNEIGNLQNEITTLSTTLSTNQKYIDLVISVLPDIRSLENRTCDKQIIFTSKEFTSIMSVFEQGKSKTQGENIDIQEKKEKLIKRKKDLEKEKQLKENELKQLKENELKQLKENELKQLKELKQEKVKENSKVPKAIKNNGNNPNKT